MSRKLIDGQLPVQKAPPKGREKGSTQVLTPELIKEICQPLLIGLPLPTSAALHRVSYDTLRFWVLSGYEHPTTVYGQFVQEIKKAIAEWEARDLSVIETHAHGRPAQYEMEVIREPDGTVLKDQNGKPMTQVAKDSNGNPILKSAEIKSDWKAALERLSRRMPRYWRSRESNEIDAVLTFDNREREARPVETMTFDEKVASAMRKFEEEY